jgi:hypothetical protein
MQNAPNSTLPIAAGKRASAQAIVSLEGRASPAIRKKCSHVGIATSVLAEMVQCSFQAQNTSEPIAKGDFKCSP